MESFWDEMEKIAEAIRVHPFLAALDCLAEHQKVAFYEGAGSVNASVAPPAAPPIPPSPSSGSTNVPGMSIHCNHCQQEVSKKAVKGGKCPHCGESLQPYRDLKGQGLPAKKRPDITTETGGEAAEQESQNQNMDDHYAKGASIRAGNPIFRIRAISKGAPTKTILKLQRKKRFKRL